MKKILSMLAAIGLTATAAGGAVSCSTGTVKSKDVKVDTTDKTASFKKTLTLNKGAILVEIPDNSKQLEVIPYKVTGDENITPFIGIVMKPKKDIKVKDIVNIGEISETTFLVNKEDVKDLQTTKVGTINNAYMLTKDTKVKADVVMDISKAFNNDDKEISWTLVNLNQVNDGYEVTSIQDKINVKLADINQPTNKVKIETVEAQA